MTAVPVAVVIDGAGMHVRVRAMLTDERPESSYGQAVLVIDDIAYGPGDVLSVHGRPILPDAYMLQTAGDGWDPDDLLWLSDQAGWHLSEQLGRLIAVAARRAGRDRELLSVPQAAAVAGVTRAAINQAISAGRLPARRVGRAWAVGQAELLAYLASRRTGSAPVAMYTTESIPDHWIISDVAGWYLVPNIPDGWERRTPYRGQVEGLRPVTGAIAVSMASIIGYTPDRSPSVSTGGASG